MKLLKHLLLIVVVQVLNLSCKKEANSVTPVPISAITVINAVVGANPVITDFSGVTPVSTYYSTTPKISYGSFSKFSKPSGNTPFVAYQTTDTLNPVFAVNAQNGLLNLQPATIYSLFLIGPDTLHVDTLFTTDNPTYYPAGDSSTGVRFVNLSPGSNPVSVNLLGSPNGSETTGLPYKGVTAFKSYPATSTITKYVFVFRDAATGDSLTTYNYTSLQRFRNVTVALKGLPGVTSGPTAQGTFLVNNF